MANSNIITTIKNHVIKTLIKDQDIVAAINSSTIPKNKPEDLLYTHIFDYNQNPYKVENVDTFITIQVHIPAQIDKNYSTVILEISIVSHYRHMKVTNIPKITVNRNDYLSQLITEKFNGSGLGLGEMSQMSNVEGCYQEDYLYRKLTFKTTDLNKSFCIDDKDI